jgi:hypothetical protein
VRQPVFDPTIEPEEDVPAASRHGVETPAMLVNILGITDGGKRYEMVRRLRWPGPLPPLRYGPRGQAGAG